MGIMSVIAVSAVSVISATMPTHAAELLLGPGAYPGVHLYPGIVAPPYAFPPAREAAPGTGRALDGVRNGPLERSATATPAPRSISRDGRC
jgi:hypothetical protein